MDWVYLQSEQKVASICPPELAFQIFSVQCLRQAYSKEISIGRLHMTSYHILT